MKAIVAAFNQEKALVGAFSVLTNLRMELFQALVRSLHCRLYHRGDQVGVQTMIVRVVGGIPGPVMFGHFIDNTCTLWSHEAGGECCLDIV